MTKEYEPFSQSQFEIFRRGIESGKITVKPTKNGYAKIKINYQNSEGDKIKRTFVIKDIDDAETLVGIQGEVDSRKNKRL